LIDGVEGGEIWADYFDRSLDDIFAVQDEITDVIVGRVHSEVQLAERQRALLTPMTNLDAWSAYHRGCWHMDRHTPGDYERAEELFKLAGQLDPRSARVFAALPSVHRQRAFLELSSDRKGEIGRAAELAQHSLSLDPHDPQAHWAIGRALMLRRDRGAASTHARSPNAPEDHAGLGRGYVGRVPLPARSHLSGRSLAREMPAGDARWRVRPPRALTEGR